MLATRSIGLNYPTLAGLLVLPSAGLLFPGDPEGAYRAAYEADFFAVGYAREATALLAAAQGAALAEFLSWYLRHFSVFDPFRALAIAFAALLSHPDDLSLALQVAANQGDLDEEGYWSRYADIDCYAGITGALVGACCGDNALPADVVEQVVAGNKAVYGFDLEETIARFTRLVASRQFH